MTFGVAAVQIGPISARTARLLRTQAEKILASSAFSDADRACAMEVLDAIPECEHEWDERTAKRWDFTTVQVHTCERCGLSEYATVSR